MISCITFDDVCPDYINVKNLESFLSVLDYNRIPCTFFVIPGCRSASVANNKFNECLKQALSKGHEVSLHGYKHTKNEFGYLVLGNYNFPLTNIPIPDFITQKNRITEGSRIIHELTGIKPSGFRAPFYLHNNLTFKALFESGFSYDSSTTIFKPTHARHFRVRSSFKYGPYESCGLLEIPVTGDYTCNLDEMNLAESLQRALGDFYWVKSHNGVFVVNIHPNQKKFSALGKFLGKLVSMLERQTSFETLKNVTANALRNSDLRQ